MSAFLCGVKQKIMREKEITDTPFSFCLMIFWFTSRKKAVMGLHPKTSIHLENYRHWPFVRVRQKYSCVSLRLMVKFNGGEVPQKVNHCTAFNDTFFINQLIQNKKKNTLNFVKYILWIRMKNSWDPEQHFFYVIPI